MGCPECHQGLRESGVDGGAIHVCPQKHGLFLPQPLFMKLLNQSLPTVDKELAKKTDLNVPNTELTEIPAGNCPLTCQMPLENYCYMGLRGIPLSRCQKCNHLWLDEKRMVFCMLAYAKTNLPHQEELDPRLALIFPDQFKIGVNGKLEAKPTPTELLAEYIAREIGRTYGKATLRIGVGVLLDYLKI